MLSGGDGPTASEMGLDPVAEGIVPPPEAAPPAAPAVGTEASVPKGSFLRRTPSGSPAGPFEVTPAPDPKDVWGTPEPIVSPAGPDPSAGTTSPIPEPDPLAGSPGPTGPEVAGSATDGATAEGSSENRIDDMTEEEFSNLPSNEQVKAYTRHALRTLKTALSHGFIPSTDTQAIAEAALVKYKDMSPAELKAVTDMSDVDIKGLLAALEGINIPDEDGAEAARADVEKSRQFLSQNTQITSGGETLSLDEWKKIAADNSDSRQAEAQAALKDGQYGLKLDPEPAAPTAEAPKLPDKYKDKSDREILNLEIADQIKVIKLKLAEARKAKNEEDVKELETILDEYRIASEGKGEHGAWGNAGVLQRVDKYLKGKGEAGVDAVVMGRATDAGDKAFDEFAHHLRQLGQNEQSITALRDYYNSGQISEIIKARADKWLVENFSGKKNMSDEKIREYVNNLISEEDRKKLMMKYGSNLSFAAILILAAVDSVRSTVTGALDVGPGR